jgi:hypothetical protein
VRVVRGWRIRIREGIEGDLVEGEEGGIIRIINSLEMERRMKVFPGMRLLRMFLLKRVDQGIMAMQGFEYNRK